MVTVGTGLVSRQLSACESEFSWLRGDEYLHSTEHSWNWNRVELEVDTPQRVRSQAVPVGSDMLSLVDSTQSE